MPKLNNYDLLFAVRRMPNPLKDLMKKNPGKIVVAGGFIRSVITGEEVQDIDLFTNAPENAPIFANELVANGKNWSLYKTDNAITIRGSRPTLQIIHRWTFPTPESILPSFDFTIAKAAIWFQDGWKSLCDDNYYADLAAKRLVYTNPIRDEAAGGSMLRVLKFYQRGYRIPLDSLSDVIARLVNGVDIEKVYQGRRLNLQETSKVICGLLREVDPLTDPDHTAHLPAATPEVDEIFAI